MKIPSFLFILSLAGLTSQASAATFAIDSIRLHEKGAGMEEGVIVKGSRPQVFVPQVEVSVQTNKDFHAKGLIARIYFFDSTNQPIGNVQKPPPAVHLADEAVRKGQHIYDWTTVLPANKPQKIFFPLPATLPEGWKSVIVFGNKAGAVSMGFPKSDERDYDYAERKLVDATAANPDQDIADADTNTFAPIIERKVESDNPRYPAFTLLLHLPHGVSDPHQVAGVLAVCLVADSVGAMRDELNSIKPEHDSRRLYAFAEEHHYAILAWGARWVWDYTYENFDETDPAKYQAWNDEFEKLAAAWDRGVQGLARDYGMPDHDFLMYGHSAGGVWVHRIALHRPTRFLAVHMHIADAYDAPTPDGSHILWLLTTGERDGGYDKARRFYEAAVALNYPIVFKAYIGLGHANSPDADALGVRFFEYVLALKQQAAPPPDAKPDFFAQGEPPLDTAAYRNPPFYGDLMNQDMFPAEQKEMIPRGFMVPLPTKEIADAWNK